MRDSEAKALAITGQVSWLRDSRPWAMSSGESIPMQQAISTGPDGYAHFLVTNGAAFDVFANSRVIFRQNVATPSDLVDVLSGRVRVHLTATPARHQRVFSPLAIISAREPSTVGVAVDDEGTVRIDVIEGEVYVQHRLRPQSDPVVVKAIDAILVERGEQISRRVDRGSLYRYTAKILSALTFGHSGHDAEPIEGNKVLATDVHAGAIRLAF
jgi:hypothetical protein